MSSIKSPIDFLLEAQKNNNAHPFGHCARIIDVMSNENSDKKDFLGTLQGYLAITDLLISLRVNSKRKKTKALILGEDNSLSTSYFREFTSVLWSMVPSFISGKDKADILTLVQGGLGYWKENPKPAEAVAYAISNNLDVVSLPLGYGSDLGVILENYWSMAMAKVPQKITDGILLTTQKILKETINECRHSGTVSNIEENISWIEEGLEKMRFEGLNKETLSWFISFSNIIHKEPHDGLTSLVMIFMPDSIYEWCVSAETGIGMKPDSLTDLIVPGGWFDRLGSLNHYNKKVEEWFKGNKFPISKNMIKALGNSHHNAKSLFLELGLANIKISNPSDALTLKDYKHIGQDALNIEAVIKSSTPMRVLIVGDSSCGKTGLAHAAARSANKRFCAPNTSNKYEFTGNWTGGALSSLQSRAKLHEDVILLLDPADKMFSSKEDELSASEWITSTEGRASLSVTEIWITNSSNHIPVNAIHAFDLVIKLGPMPLSSREELAGRYFDPAISKSVAQACPLPGEIVSLANWSKATQLTDWQALSTRLAGIQQAEFSNKESTGNLPVSIHPPRIGHPGFSDVIGQDTVVAQARKIISGLKNPERYKLMGAKPPKGILLTGGPGYGKTHLARAMAGEAGVNLLLATSSAMARNPDLISTVFAEARRQAPCLLFLDELDAIGTTPKGAAGATPDPERQAILNQLLTELDGFEGMEGVMVVGATHRSDLLDPALIRSGRLGIHLNLKETSRVERKALWAYYTKNIPCSDVISWERISQISVGMSPADIAQAANSAAMRAAEDDCDRVGYAHLVESIDEVLWSGNEDDLPIKEDQKWRTAIHEAGHALLAWRDGSDIDRASIRPRSVALGYVRTIPEEGKYCMGSSDILAKITMLFGGLAAEEIVFGSHTSGVRGDLETARSLARQAIRNYAMSPEAPAGFPDMFEPSPSESWIERVEKIEIKMLADLRSQAVSWITTHRDTLEALAQKLLEEREMDGKDIHELIESRICPNSRGLLKASNNDIGVAAQSHCSGPQAQSLS